VKNTENLSNFSLRALDKARRQKLIETPKEGSVFSKLTPTLYKILKNTLGTLGCNYEFPTEKN